MLERRGLTMVSFSLVQLVPLSIAPAFVSMFAFCIVLNEEVGRN